MSDDKGVVLRHQVAELRFGMMSESEVRSSSVKAVTSPATCDSLGHPLPGGLHDPAFGPSDRNTLCPTCGLTFSDCPGHPGKERKVYVIVICAGGPLGCKFG